MFPSIPNELLDEVEDKVEAARVEGVRIRTRILVVTAGVFLSVGLAMFFVSAPPSA